MAHPASAIAVTSRIVKRKSSPVCCFGPGGRPQFSLPSPSRSRGMARRQGAAWIAPGWNGLGVKRHALRLAARQRGILAFMPLTVVGPGRLLVADEAARVRPGDEGCVSPSLAGAAPVPRLQNASGRRPSKLGSGWGQHSYALGEVKHNFTISVLLDGEWHLSTVVPAKAGTHTPQRSAVTRLMRTISCGG